jgi:hypothetical protein
MRRPHIAVVIHVVLQNLKIPTPLPSRVADPIGDARRNTGDVVCYDPQIQQPITDTAGEDRPDGTALQSKSKLQVGFLLSV